MKIKVRRVPESGPVTPSKPLPVRPPPAPAPRRPEEPVKVPRPAPVHVPKPLPPRTTTGIIPVSPPKPKDSEKGESSIGDQFVRMMNRKGLVRGVIVKLVAFRLCDGYRFIEGEPAVPQLYGDPDKLAFATGRPYPRAIPGNPNKESDGLRLWHAAMMEDYNTHGDDARLDFKWLDHVQEAIVRAESRAK